MSLWLSIAVMGIAYILLSTVISLPSWSEHLQVGLAWSLALSLGLWAYVARWNQELEMLEKAMPPELRLAVDLRKRAEAFRERARALEEAMDEATAISEQVQRGIELERQQLSDLHEQYLKQARLNELTHEQQVAVADLLGQQQARSARRALWSNIVVGFVFYVAGVVTPALINMNTLRDQLQQWLHLS
jgi:hypothetical protein